MELPLKRLIDERFIRKDGTCIVFIQYQYTSIKRTLLNTQIEIPPAFWNYDEGCIEEGLPPHFGKPDELNNELRRMYRVAEDIVLFIQQKKLPNPGEFAKKTFTPRFESASLKQIAKELEKGDVKTNLDIFFQIDDYLLTRLKK